MTQEYNDLRQSCQDLFDAVMLAAERSGKWAGLGYNLAQSEENALAQIHCETAARSWLITGAHIHASLWELIQNGGGEGYKELATEAKRWEKEAQDAMLDAKNCLNEQ